MLERRIPVHEFIGDSSCETFGRRLDIRVAVLMPASGELYAFWVESWAFESFADFAARTAAESAPESGIAAEPGDAGAAEEPAAAPTAAPV